VVAIRVRTALSRFSWPLSIESGNELVDDSLPQRAGLVAASAGATLADGVGNDAAIAA